MRGKLIIEIPVENEKLLTCIVEALKPETYDTLSKDVRAKVKISDGKVFLILEAHTTATLRAILNSYLTWIDSIVKSIIEVENVGRKNTT